MSNRKGIWVAILSFVIVSMACSVPVIDSIFKADATPTSTQETPVATSGPTSTPLPPLPPTLLEVEPALGVELKPDAPITLSFDQPMDTESVEYNVDIWRKNPATTEYTISEFLKKFKQRASEEGVVILGARMND